MKLKWLFVFLILILSLSAVVLSACARESESYMLRYVDSDGEVITINVKKGDIYSVTIPTKAGYSFKGLYDQEIGGVQYVGSNGLSIANWSEQSDKNLFIQWTPQNVTIRFEADGGTLDEKSITVK